MTKARELADVIGTQSTTENVLQGRRNLIINGAMQVAQRGTSFDLNSTNTYTLDRWSSNTGSGFDFDVTVTQSTEAPDGFSRSLKISPNTVQTPSAYQNATFTTRLEGQDVQCLGFGTASAKDVTLSFWVKSNKTGTYSVHPYIHNSTPVSGVYAYTIDSADTWEYKTINLGSYSATSIEVTDNSKAMQIFFALACGSSDQITPTNAFVNSISGLRAATGQVNIMDSTSNNFYLTGVQLEVGSVATPFEHRSYGEELALCQRYFIRALENAVADYYCYPAKGQGASAVRMGFYLNCPMRATPSIVQNGDWRVFASNGYKGDSGNTATVNYYKTNGNLIALEVGGYTGLVDNYAYVVGARNMTSLDFDAEL